MAELGLEGQLAVVVLDERSRDREPLAGAAADLLGREERIEDLVANRRRDTGAGIADRDIDVIRA